MKNIAKLAAIAAAVAAFGSANASTILIETGYSTAGPLASADAYKAAVEAAIVTPGAGYGSINVNSYDNLSNHGLFGSSSNIAFKSTITFGVAAGETGNWSFRGGVDFGRGGAVFLDGQAVDFRSNDMWWNGSYGNTSQFFAFNAAIGAGNHTLNVYGLEGCCDGGQQFQFNAGSGYHSFDTSTLTPVPEAQTYAMMLAGLGLLGFMRRRSSKQA